MVRNLKITGKHKLQDRWNSLPYVVIAKLPNLPVYRVKPERGTGIVKTVHRDHSVHLGEDACSNRDESTTKETMKTNLLISNIKQSFIRLPD